MLAERRYCWESPRRPEGRPPRARIHFPLARVSDVGRTLSRPRAAQAVGEWTWLGRWSARGRIRPARFDTVFAVVFTADREAEAWRTVGEHASRGKQSRVRVRHDFARSYREHDWWAEPMALRGEADRYPKEGSVVGRHKISAKICRFDTGVGHLIRRYELFTRRYNTHWFLAGYGRCQVDDAK